MTRAHKISATVEPDGSLNVRNLPFSPGERVEVIILAPDEQPASERYPLQGTPYRYDQPFEAAVDPDEWEANR
jgi:hypothetical protein